MLCVYDKNIKTRFPDYINIEGHYLSAKGNNAHAIACHSWAIAFNPPFFSSKPNYLNSRGREYFKNKYPNGKPDVWSNMAAEGVITQDEANAIKAALQAKHQNKNK